jgi:hypothetical protein
LRKTHGEAIMNAEADILSASELLRRRAHGSTGVRSAPKRWLLKSKKGRLSETESVHLDRLLDEALRETFPASDPIAITIDRPSKAIAAELLQSADDPPMSAPPTATEPKSALVSVYDAHLWGINQIFDWWLLLLGCRAGK